jgi:hypothetical protein
MIKVNVDFSTLPMLYFALFQSHLAYCIILWGNSSKGNIHRVLTIPKNAIRVITGICCTDSCHVKFKELGILIVLGLFVFTLLMYVKRNLATLLQDPVTHLYTTRNKVDYIRPKKHSTAIYEKSVSYSGLQLYNLLPFKIRNLKEPEYKQKVKTFQIMNPMYDIQEFYDIDKNLM